MNNEIKVNLTVILPGRDKFEEEKCRTLVNKVIKKKNKKTGKLYTKNIEVWEDSPNMVDFHSMKVSEKGNNSEIITFTTRKYKPATQSININKEAYKYMTGNEFPAWSSASSWKQMNRILRLESHLDRIAEDLGGEVLSYKIFDD